MRSLINPISHNQREMGRLVNREEIVAWKKEGWTFRVKTVKEKRYITRRKGNKEKSLGRFHGELWALIEKAIRDTRKDTLKVKKEREYENLVNSIVVNMRAFEMSKKCAHIVNEYCHYWGYDERPGFFNIVDYNIGKEYYKKIKKKGFDSLWVFRAVPFYCQNCPSYKRK
jgi:hypothetical protein